MSTGVEFDEDKFRYANPQRPGGMNMGGSSGARSSMNAWLMKHGLAKSDKSAQAILVAVVVINAIITFVVFKYFL